MSRYRNIFLLASPLQVLNAIEACSALGISTADSLVVICDSGSEINNRQVRRMLAEENWGAILVVPYHGPNLPAWFGRMRVLNSIVRSNPKCENLGIGDYGFDLARHFANTLQCGRVIQLDDGIVTVELARSRTDPDRPKYFYGPPFTTRGKLRLKRLLGMRDKLLPALTYFTVYNVTPESGSVCVPNRFERLRSGLRTAINPDTMYFLGAPAVGMPEDEYLELVARAMRHLGGFRNKYYLPHRHEGAQRQERLARDLNLKCLRFDAPIEYGICRLAEAVPQTVAGFPSTAFDTLQAIFGDQLRYRVFHCPEPDVPIHHQMAEGHYAYYRQHYRAPGFQLILDF